MNAEKSLMLCAVFLLVLAGTASPFLLYGTIKNEQDTRLTGTFVELLQSGTVISTATAASEGKYSFNVTTPGTYILRFTRDGYPQTIAVVNVSSDSQRDVVMWATSLASMYGQVAYADGMPANELFGEKVRLQKNGVFVVGLEGKIIGPSGSYAITSIEPGTYTVVLSSDALDYEKKTITLTASKAEQVNIIVSKKSTAQNNTDGQNQTKEAFTIVAPGTAIEGSQVKVVLFSTTTGAVSGAVLLVKGPGIDTSLDPTDANGETHFTPAQAGTYTIVYGGYSIPISVSMQASNQTQEPEPQQNSTVTLPPITPPKTVQEQAIFGVGATFAIAIAIIAVLAVAGAAYYLYTGRKRKEGELETPQEIKLHKAAKKGRKAKGKRKDMPEGLQDIIDMESEKTESFKKQVRHKKGGKAKQENDKDD
ncbi:MAG: carboxypeptidase regulatory-like domain-containing protein [Candidatus Micrarchaeia archaeon]